MKVRNLVNDTMQATEAKSAPTAVLVPFKMNTFAVAEARTSTHFGRFLDRLVPAQVRAVGHLILQTHCMDMCTSKLLARFKGLVNLQYVLLTQDNYIMGPLPVHLEDLFAEAIPSDLVGLPQLRNISIELREYPYDARFATKDTDKLPDAVLKWVENAEKKMLEGSRS